MELSVTCRCEDPGSNLKKLFWCLSNKESDSSFCGTRLVYAMKIGPISNISRVVMLIGSNVPTYMHYFYLINTLQS